MIKRTVLLTLAMLAFMVTSASADKVDKIIKENKEACGAEILDNVKSVTLNAEVTMMGMVKKVNFLALMPDKFKVEETTNGVKVTLATNGKTGWVDQMGQKMTLPHENVAGQFKQFEILYQSPFSDLDRDSTEVKMSGRETIDNIDAFKMTATEKDGSKTTLWVAKDSKFVIQAKSETSQGVFIIKFKDYKNFNGATVATNIDITMQGAIINFKTVSLKFNEKMSAADFDPPADAKPAPMGQ